MANIIRFSHSQKSDILEFFEDRGYHLSGWKSDARDDELLSELLFFMSRMLDEDQAEQLNSQL